MRHRKNLRKLGKTSKHRQAMLRNMVTDFFKLGHIKSTDIKLKELKRYAEKLITLAKRGTLHARRLAAAKIRDKEVLKKLFEEIAPHFNERPGGYTRIIKLGYRKGDSAPISMIELLEEEYTIKPVKKAKPKKAKKAKPADKEEATASKSTKKESAEELGLIESEAETQTEEASSEQEPPPEKKAETKAEAKAEAKTADETPPEEETAQEAKAEEASSEQEPPEETKADAEQEKKDKE